MIQSLCAGRIVVTLMIALATLYDCARLPLSAAMAQAGNPDRARRHWTYGN
jgi:hypothetical protein